MKTRDVDWRKKIGHCACAPFARLYDGNSSPAYMPAGMRIMKNAANAAGPFIFITIISYEFSPMRYEEAISTRLHAHHTTRRTDDGSACSPHAPSMMPSPE